MIRSRRTALQLAAATVLSGLALVLAAQDAYPSESIRIVVF